MEFKSASIAGSEYHVDGVERLHDALDRDDAHSKQIRDCLVHLSVCHSVVPQGLGEDEKIFMIGGAEIAHLFLKHKLISSFILTRIHRLYSGDTYLDLNYFKGWRKTVLKSSPHYTILQLTNI
jgi:dihydrofolate reductase